MGILLNKSSHLKRFKISHGISVSSGGSATCGYLAERKLKKIFKERVTDQIYEDFKAKKNYNPPYLASSQVFLDKLLQRVEKDRRVGDSLKFFYNNGLMATIERYLNKHNKNRRQQ